MKKTFYCLIIFALLGTTARAQFYYARIGVGVSGSISSNRDLLYAYTNNGSSRTVTVVPLGLGRGFTGTAAFGFKPNKWLGIEIGISEFVGLPKVADSVLSLPGGTSAKAKVQGNMLSAAGYCYKSGF